LKSYKVFKRKGLTADNVEWFANAIETSVIKLPELQHDYKNLQNKVQTMQYQNQKLERDLQVIQRQIAELTEVENMHQQNVDTLQDDIEHLYNEKSELQQFVSRFKNSNKRYIQIKRIAEEVVDRLLKERKWLLSSALVAVVEALRMNPDRYAVIYNSKYDNNDNILTNSTMAAAVPSTYNSTSTRQ
jgi:chromosome segregation ATPase